MTLALILAFTFYCTAPVLPMQQDAGATPSAPAANKSATTPDAQDQGKPPEAQSPATPPKSEAPAAGPASKPSGATQLKRRRHKKLVSADCAAPAPVSTVPATGTPANATTDPNAVETATTPKPQTAPTNCPPPKIIVRQGGTSEPSIQLEGGASGDQAARQRDAANQMLHATEANLKKMSDRQLTKNQQDMIGQVRQFMQQSKSAMATGDVERGRTLAWKAQLLSEELMKPQR